MKSNTPFAAALYPDHRRSWRSVMLALLVGIAFGVAEPALGDVTLTTVSNGRNVDVTATTPGAAVDSKFLQAPTPFDYWNVSPIANVKGDIGSANVNAFHQSEATLSYLAASVGISGSVSDSGSIRGSNSDWFTFAVQGCHGYTFTSSLAAGISDTGTASFEFMAVYPASLDAVTIEEHAVSGSDAESILNSTAQLSPGDYMVRAGNKLPLTSGDGYYTAPSSGFLFVFQPCVAPLISQQPQGGTVLPGHAAALTVVAAAAGAGSSDFTYEWLFKGQPLVDDGRIEGVTTDSLSILNFGAADVGAYSVWVDDGTIRQLSSLAILVPEPGSALMIGCGAFCLVGLADKQNRRRFSHRP